jgi:hypothetical protein
MGKPDAAGRGRGSTQRIPLRRNPHPHLHPQALWLRQCPVPRVPGRRPWLLASRPAGGVAPMAVRQAPRPAPCRAPPGLRATSGDPSLDPSGSPYPRVNPSPRALSGTIGCNWIGPLQAFPLPTGLSARSERGPPLGLLPQVLPVDSVSSFWRPLPLSKTLFAARGPLKEFVGTLEGTCEALAPLDEKLNPRLWV